MSARKRPLAAISDLINNMDARAWRVVWAAIIMLVVAGVILAVSRLLLGDQIEQGIRSWLNSADAGHWGLPAAIAVFTVAAYLAAPQVVLIAACVVAFGPERGFWYAWIATIASGAVTYLTGRIAGAAALKRYGGATGGRFTQFMERNAFFASFVVRMLPTAPFVVVNIAMAAARMKFLPFIAGLALGVLPKTAILTFGYDGIMDAVEGNFGSAAAMGGAAIAAWVLGMVVIRRLVRKEALVEEKPSAAEEVDAKVLRKTDVRGTGTE